MDERQLFDAFHSAFDVEPRPGMRERIRTALLSSDVSRRARPWFQSSVLDSLSGDRLFGESSRGRIFRLAAGAIVVALAAAAVAGLLHSRGTLNHTTPVWTTPSPPPCASEPTPVATVPFSSSSLQSLTGLANPSFLTPFQLQATIGPARITLIRAYADPLTTVLILRPDAASRIWWLEIMHDDQGEKIPGGGPGELIDAGQYKAQVFKLPGPRGYGTDGIAHLSIALGLQSILPAQQPVGPPEYVEDLAAGSTSLSFSLCVHPASQLSVPAPFRLGSWTVTMKSIELTPAILRTLVVIDGVRDFSLLQGATEGLYRVGPPCPGAPPTNLRDTTCLASFAGGQIGPSLDFEWFRPAAGRYQFLFSGDGARHAVALDVPALPTP